MTEETIDVERMMLGIDDEDSHVTIPWIKCSERMPPDDDTEIIVKSHGYFTRHEGSDLRAWLSTDHAEWIPYDEDTWRKLND